MGFDIGRLEDDSQREQGVWYNQRREEVTEPNPADLELLIAPAGTDRFRDALTKYLERNARSASRLASRRRTPEEDEAASIHAMAEACLLDWRHLTNGDGGEVRYSKTKARELLTESKKLRALVSELCMFERDLMLSFEGDTLGNSSSASAGNASTETS